MNKKYIDFVPKVAVHEEMPVKEVRPVVEYPVADNMVVRPERKPEVRPAKKPVMEKLVEERPVEGKSEKSVKPAKRAVQQDDDDRMMASAVNDAHKLEKKFKIPKVAFVNTEKVVKRPLSKNVYAKKIETPKEEPQGPVTIIEKPEKDSKAGLIVTIIITIILGAAAGTVAFLLLPK